jgi:hypothetical protein
MTPDPLAHGDDEAVLRLHRLPTLEQAAVIREVLGIRKQQEISAATLDRLRAFAFERSTRGEAISGAGNGGDSAGGFLKPKSLTQRLLGLVFWLKSWHLILRYGATA